MNNKTKIIITILLFIIIINYFIIKSAYSYQSLYDFLKPNSIIIGNHVYDGFVSPNEIIKSSIEEFDETENQNIPVYKYSGLTLDNKPIWGKFDEESNCYIEVSNEEILSIENKLKTKYNIN